MKSSQIQKENKEHESHLTEKEIEMTHKAWKYSHPYANKRNTT